MKKRLDVRCRLPFTLPMFSFSARVKCLAVGVADGIKPKIKLARQRCAGVSGHGAG